MRSAPFDRCFVQNVDMNKNGFYLICRLRSAFDVDVRNNQLRACLAEALGACESDTASASGGNDLASE
jgi:hypothetical protein